jgi:hypothetical protein
VCMWGGHVHIIISSPICMWTMYTFIYCCHADRCTTWCIRCARWMWVCASCTPLTLYHDFYGCECVTVQGTTAAAARVSAVCLATILIHSIYNHNSICVRNQLNKIPKNLALWFLKGSFSHCICLSRCQCTVLLVFLSRCSTIWHT